MDSSAYLRKHGWQGTGHSLQPTKTHALKRPLLVSRKIDVLGLGTNKHAAVTDQWWLKAFDASLRDFGSGKTSTLGNVRQYGVKAGGLYGRFVKGESVVGTIGLTGIESGAGGDGDPDRKTVSVLGPRKRKAGEDGRTADTKKTKRGSGAAAAGDGSESGATSAELFARLSRRKRARYASRAAEKGMDTTEYFARRTKRAKSEKKNKDKTETETDNDVKAKIGRKNEDRKKKLKHHSQSRTDASTNVDRAEAFARLSKHKQARYASRAAEKGMDAIEYFAHRTEKAEGKNESITEIKKLKHRSPV